MRKFIKYSVRVVLGILALLLVLLVLAGLLIQTSPVKQKIARVASQKVSAMINGQLEIGGIGGNFFNSLELKNIVLSNQQDTLAAVNLIEARYNLWSLLYGHLQVYTVQINQPYLQLIQLKDSTWNVQHLMKPPSSQPDTSSTGSFAFDIAQFKIEEGEFKIESPDTLLPQMVQHLNTRLSFHYAENKQVADLHQLSLQTESPDFQLKNLAFRLRRNGNKIQLHQFNLQTQKNQLGGEATLTDQPKLQATIDLKSDSLYLAEFRYFLSGFKLPAHPVINLKGTLNQDSLHATAQIDEQIQAVQLELNSANFGGFIQNNPSDSLLEYQLKASLKNIALAHWLGDPQLNFLVNGNVTARGKGFDPKTAKITVAGDFKDCMIEEKPIADLHLTAHLQNGTLDGEARGKGDFGSFWIKPQIQHLQSTPVYQASLRTENLDLAQLTGNDSLKSTINLQAHVTGKGFDPKSLSANGQITMSKSGIYHLAIDSVLAQVRYENENVMVDSLLAKTENVNLTAHGNYSLKGQSDLRLVAKFDDVAELGAFFPVTGLKTSGSLKGHLWGSTDSLIMQSSIDLGETRYQDYLLNRAKIVGNGLITSKDTIFKAHVVAEQFQSSPINLDSLAFDVRYVPDSILIDGNLANADLQSQLQAGLHLGDTMRLTLPRWKVDYKNQHWSLTHGSAVLVFDSLNYRINHFRMASDNSDTAQYVTAQGQVSQVGQNNFELKAANINLKQLAAMFNLSAEPSGVFSMDLQLDGKADTADLKGNFGIDRASFNKFSFSEFGGSLHSDNNRLVVQARIVPIDSGRVELAGSVPFQLKMDSLQFDMNPKDSIDLKLTVDKFPLAVLQTFNLADEIKGAINGDVTVKGTVESPDPTGNLRMKNASVKVERYGVDYHDIRFSMNFLRNKMKLDTFLIKTADGDLTADGKIDFSSDFYKGDISQSQINLKFDHFNPVDHPRFNMQVDGNASLGGKKDSVIFDGNLTVPQSEFYLPAIYNLMGKVEAPEIPKPLLVQAMDVQTTPKDPVASDSIKVANTDSVNWSYFDHLTGTIKLNIPQNTWIKDEDMHIEISGDLKMIKHPTFFELFGTLDVVRGQYDLFGRTFIINDGSINFEGGENIMPKVNINASYAFRNAQQVQQKLDVSITGTAENPSVKFSLDGSSVSEGDALSYILFGKSMNELSMNQQENVAGAGNIAGKAAASILSSQLTSYLGKKLNVDYIEVKGSGDFNNATVVVGKYITNNLFVSYEQRFGETDQKNMAKYEVKLEYELFRSLFFQLNNSSNDSGFDVIYKFDTK